MSRRRWFPYILALSVAGPTFAGQASAAEGPSQPASQAPGEIVVRYLPGAGADERSEARETLGTEAQSSSPVAGLEVLEVPPGVDVQEAAAQAEALPQVLYAEPNYTYRIATVPNDPLYRQLWALGPSNRSGMNSGIDAPSAWEAVVGSPSVTVAVVDSGVDATHPDLAGNMWINPGEGGDVAANGVDDDGNGFVDDAQGWDWIDDDNTPADPLGHGTHTAGTVGAVGNNGVGISGVSWSVRLMALRVIDGSGAGFASDVAAAFTYAARAGAQIVNASLTGPEPSQAMYDAIAAAPQTLFVVAAGNESKNTDLSPSYPCSFDLPNLICVAATGQFNELAPFSNWGPRSVDLAAPGMRIVSTWPGGGYAEGMGTSAASPHVAGAAALVWARSSGGAPAVRDALLRGVEPLVELRGRTATGGRLNAAGALGREQGDRVAPDRRRCKRKPLGHQRQRRRRAGRCRSRR